MYTNGVGILLKLRCIALERVKVEGVGGSAGVKIFMRSRLSQRQ